MPFYPWFNQLHSPDSLSLNEADIRIQNKYGFKTDILQA